MNFVCTAQNHAGIKNSVCSVSEPQNVIYVAVIIFRSHKAKNPVVKTGFLQISAILLDGNGAKFSAWLTFLQPLKHVF